MFVHALVFMMLWACALCACCVSVLGVRLLNTAVRMSGYGFLAGLHPLQHIWSLKILDHGNQWGHDVICWSATWCNFAPPRIAVGILCFAVKIPHIDAVVRCSVVR